MYGHEDEMQEDIYARDGLNERPHSMTRPSTSISTHTHKNSIDFFLPIVSTP